MTLTEKFDSYFQAQRDLFEGIGVSLAMAEVIEDHRQNPWSGDHGVVWWADKDHGYQESHIDTFVNKDGFFFCRSRNNGNTSWLLFTNDLADDNFGYDDHEYARKVSR